MKYAFLHVSTAIVLLLICGGSIYAFTHVKALDSLDSAIADCKDDGYAAQQCLNDLVVHIGKEEGLDAGFDALQAVYLADSEFAASCHGTTHELGSQAFDQFERGDELHLDDKTSYCGFGFFHGFVEILMQTGKDLAEARTFCEESIKNLESSIAGIAASCYHGIGHGVVDGTDPETWGDDMRYIAGGLALCERLTTDEEYRERCASGVFNALAIVYDDEKYNLRPDKHDPYRVCRLQKSEWAKDACYDQLNGYINRMYPVFTDALRIAEQTSEVSHRKTAVRAVAGYHALLALTEARPLSDVVNDCAVVSIEWRDVCANSFAVGLIEFGKPKQEFIIATNACVDAEAFTSACLAGVKEAVRLRLDSSLHGVACEYIEKKASDYEGALCRTYMGL